MFNNMIQARASWGLSRGRILVLLNKKLLQLSAHMDYLQNCLSADDPFQFYPIK